MEIGITLDTGALIAIEKRDRRMKARLERTRIEGRDITVPAAVVAEWWRGGNRQAQILDAFNVEPMSERLAKIAGEALAALPTATIVDAIVMASASLRGDIVYTSDFEDLDRLHTHFQAVHKVLRVSPLASKRRRK